jgi:hypothetical protein
MCVFLVTIYIIQSYLKINDTTSVKKKKHGITGTETLNLKGLNQEILTSGGLTAYEFSELCFHFRV